MKKYIVLLGVAGLLLANAQGQSPQPAAAAPAPQVPRVEAAPPAPSTLPTPPPAAAIPAPAAPTEAAPAPEPIVVKTTVTPATTGPIEIAVDAESRGISVATNQAYQNLISISVERAPLAEVVRAFTQLSGANIIMGTNGHEPVTVSMRDVEWEPALRAILDSAGKTLVTKSPGIYMVGSKSESASEPVTVETIKLQYTTPLALLPTIEKMLVGTNTSVSSVASANMLIIKTTPNNISDIRKAIQCVDTARAQVFIEAKFVELNDEAIKDLGINWQSLSGITLSATNLAASLTRSKDNMSARMAAQANSDQRVHGDGVNKFYDNNGQPSTSVQGPLSFGGSPSYSVKASSGGSGGGSGAHQPPEMEITAGTVNSSGGSGRVIQDTIQTAQANVLGLHESSAVVGSEVLTAVLSASDFAMTLSALKQNIGATVVSNPRLLVASGEKATIHVGKNEPYAQKSTAQSGSGGSSTQSEIGMIKTGVQLLVTPTVNSESNVTLRIRPELSNKSGTVVIDGNPVPIITTRDVETEFNVDSGRTVAIGGLVSDDNQERVSKIPLLGDIPIIGKYLFSHTHTDRMKSEIIVFVSVSVVKAEKIKDNEGIPSTGKLIHRFVTTEKVEMLEDQRQREAEEKALKAAQAKKVDSKTGKKRRASLFE
jgi:type II secretory pathway component GspD/PulD (secretin)